jgi:hypothetical protein
MRKEAIMVLFEELSWHLPGTTRKTMQTFSQRSRRAGLGMNPASPD